MSEPKADGADHSLALPHLVKWAEMAVRARVERAIASWPISSSQLFALALMEEQGELTSAELARLMHLTPQAMTTLLAPLRAQGMIERRADLDHGRKLLISLTPDGRAMLERAHALNPVIEGEVLKLLSQDDRVTLARLLGAIARPPEG